MHLSDRALLVHLSLSQWAGKKLDKKASLEIARLNGVADGVHAGNFNKTLLPTCNELGRVHQEGALIRKEFYRNTLPWGIEGTFILPSANYLSFMTEYRGKKGKWEALTIKLFDAYEQAVVDAQRLLPGLFNPGDYPTLADLRTKFSMELTILPVPTAGDFRVELADDEYDSIKADIEERVEQCSRAAIKDVWDRLYAKVEWLNGRLADPNTTFHDETYRDAQDTCRLLTRLNFTEDPQLEEMRQKAEQQLFSCHPESLRNDPVLRQDTANEAQAIMNKMAVFMEGF